MVRRRMQPGPDPFEMWRAGAEMTRMALEAQTVIGLRLLGMAGLWSVAPSENGRMVSEKAAAFAKAGAAMGRAAGAGKSAEAIVRAGVKPIGRVTSRNVKRLSRRGPKLPGLPG